MTRAKSKSARAEGGGSNSRTRGPFRALLLALHAAAVLAVLTELLLPAGEHIKRARGLDFPASYAVYGLLAGVLLVWLAIVLRRLVMRGAHYYGEPD